MELLVLDDCLIVNVQMQRAAHFDGLDDGMTFISPGPREIASEVRINIFDFAHCLLGQRVQVSCERVRFDGFVCGARVDSPFIILELRHCTNLVFNLGTAGIDVSPVTKLTFELSAEDLQRWRERPLQHAVMMFLDEVGPALSDAPSSVTVPKEEEVSLEALRELLGGAGDGTEAVKFTTEGGIWQPSAN